MLLTAHELVAIAPTLSEMEANAFFDYPSKAIAVFDPSLADRFDTDIHDIRLSVSFAAALEGRYAPVASAAWPAFRQQDYTARTLREALPRVLRAAAVQAYTKHLDDLSSSARPAWPGRRTLSNESTSRESCGTQGCVPTLLRGSPSDVRGTDLRIRIEAAFPGAASNPSRSADAHKPRRAPLADGLAVRDICCWREDKLLFPTADQNVEVRAAHAMHEEVDAGWQPSGHRMIDTHRRLGLRVRPSPAHLVERHTERTMSSFNSDRRSAKYPTERAQLARINLRQHLLTDDEARAARPCRHRG
jgi:hypothetical protein